MSENTPVLLQFSQAAGWPPPGGQLLRAWHRKQELEAVLQRPVDLLRLHERIHPALRQVILLVLTPPRQALERLDISLPPVLVKA